MQPVLTTASLCIGLVCLLFTLQCGIVNRYRPDPATRLLGWSTLAAAFGMTLVLARPPVPEMVAISFGSALNLLAIGLGWRTAAHLFGRKLPTWWALPAPLLWLACCCLLPSFMTDRSERILIGTTMASMLIGLGLAELLRAPVRTTAHRALLVLGPFHLFCSILGMISVLCPTLLPWSRATMTMLPFETLTYVMLWSGLMLTLIAENAILYERERAGQDELSGVLNRRGFWAAAEGMHDRTILLFDIDHFKRINDTFGHAAGDTVIRRFTGVASALLGAGVAFGRVGGEEFAAAMSGVSLVEARRRAEQVRLAFANAFAHGTSVTVSVGLSVGVPDQCLNDQMALADRALYRAKRLGRNRVELHVARVAATQPEVAVRSAMPLRRPRLVSSDMPG